MHVEDAGAAAAVERLDDHLAAELVQELLQPRGGRAVTRLGGMTSGKLSA